MTGSHDWSPNEFTMPAGGSITWFNESAFSSHTVTFGTGPDCGYVVVNGSVSVTFNTAGTFTFLCRIHPQYMTGTVTVQ